MGRRLKSCGTDGSRRRHWYTLPSRYALPGGAATTALAAALAVAPLGADHPASIPAAFVVQPASHDTVAVKIVNTRVAAEQMTRQLHQQGLNITIETVPVSPQLVGTWVMNAVSADVPASVAQAITAQVPNGYTATVEVLTTFPGQIILSAGRAPQPGEEPVVIGTVNALAPGGRLGCLHATGAAPSRVRAAAQGLGYIVTWADGDRRDTPAIQLPTAGQLVTAGFIDDAAPDTVRLVTATPGTRVFEARARLGYAPRQWASRATNPATCTRP